MQMPHDHDHQHLQKQAIAYCARAAARATTLNQFHQLQAMSLFIICLLFYITSYVLLHEILAAWVQPQLGATSQLAGAS